MSRRVMVIGLDCAPPALVFDRLARSLPNLTALTKRGAWGRLRSVTPPITVPAWACMVSGRDPGELGLYGFRARPEGSYQLRTSTRTDAPRIWDLASAAGKKVCVLYVPLTSPPSKVNGQMVSCFLHEGGPHTHPPELGAALEARFGPHAPDVSEFRTEDKGALLDELYDTTRQHFAVARALWVEERPDLMMMVEMGTDRLHHAFWRHLDPTHPEHDAAHPLVREACDYYAFVDAELGALVELADDDTSILVVSDHGARAMRGGVCVNEWLRRRGWLTLRDEPSSPARLTPEMVDWSRTKAWGAGGYYGRIFFNVAGRESEGVIEASDLDAEVTALVAELEADPLIRARAHRPAELYREVKGAPPELLVFFGDLDYRSLGSVGGEVFQLEDDRGPDGCNHDWDGVYIACGGEARGELEGLSIHDVGPTALRLLDLDAPPDWLGRDRSSG